MRFPPSLWTVLPWYQINVDFLPRQRYSGSQWLLQNTVSNCPLLCFSEPLFSEAFPEGVLYRQAEVFTLIPFGFATPAPNYPKRRTSFYVNLIVWMLLNLQMGFGTLKLSMLQTQKTLRTQSPVQASASLPSVGGQTFPTLSFCYGCCPLMLCL